MSDRAAQTIGVVGAGTMGAGIAQLACKAGANTLLYDPIYEALMRGTANARAGLEKEVSRGKLTVEQALEASERLESVESPEQLSSCELVIEAAPERLEIKHELYARLSEIVSEQCVLASNTSSLPITAVAAGATYPERVVGMHFFNPAPLMRLLEVIPGLLSDERALAIARATGLAMGKDVIRAADVPGFIVNRCNRPFGLEALRLLQERIADIETIDRIVRLGGGFRMGPFELSDLVGVDTGFDVSKSFYELSFGEPRWRPSPIQARQVAAGLHGRKTGRGYYDYSGEGPHRPADPDPPAGGGDALVTGSGPVADALRALAPGHGGPEIAVNGLSGTVDGEPFYAIVPLALVEVTGETGEQAFRGLGLHTERVLPAPAGVLARIVCQVINESAFALGEGVGSTDDIDTGMMLGLSHPRGPFAWMREIGPAYVLSTIEALGDEYREERYRPAPALRRLAAEAD
ncbi:MAG: 3-hydroxyacyl-CoA dehydrogenase NAD-binding domain-containing protein [Solirubrobacteraceae bacterium]